MLSNFTSLPSFLQAHHLYVAFQMFLGFNAVIFSPHAITYLGKYGVYKASDLLLGDNVCEKSDAVKWIKCP